MASQGMNREFPEMADMVAIIFSRRIRGNLMSRRNTPGHIMALTETNSRHREKGTRL
jgi:hypothetical protein